MSDPPQPARQRFVRPKYQVFVSSTWDDLRDQRQAVIFQILKDRLMPTGMEAFTAADDRGWETIKRTIDQCDYYVVLVAGRYGTIDPATGRSWTEREYDYAGERKLKRLAFIRDDDAINKSELDKDPASAALLPTFVKKLRDAHLCEKWSEAGDLVAAVGTALRNTIQEDEDAGTLPPGWYRGDQIIAGAAAMDEFARLSDENRVLRDEVARLRASQENQTADLVLWLPNRPPVDLVFDKSIYAPRLQPRGTNIYAALEGPQTSDIAKFVLDAYRTLWLPLRVRNVGQSVARNVTLDLWIAGIDSIDFDAPDIPEGSLRVRAFSASRALDASKPTYFDRPTRDDRQWRIRGRIPVLSAANTEEMPLIGLAADVDRARQGNEPPFNVEVRYLLAEERGQVVEGAFRVTCSPSLDPFEGSLREIAAHTLRATDAAFRASASQS